MMHRQYSTSVGLAPAKHVKSHAFKDVDGLTPLVRACDPLLSMSKISILY
jgi:hypothetical protein